MRSYNKIILIGNLAADPEVKTTKSGTLMAVFPLATNRHWNDSTGNKQSEVDYHRVTCFGNLAKISSEHLAKGAGIALDGRLTNHVFDNAKGEKVYITEVVADNINILSWKKENKKTKVST